MSTTSIAVRAATVTHAHDAPPFARATARLLDLNNLSDEGAARLAEFRGVVALKSQSDPQKATIRCDDSGVRVEHGADSDADVVMVVDVTTPGVPLSADPDDALAAAATTLLNPELPEWTELAAAFWGLVRNLPAMPSLRIVELGTEREVLLDGGDGTYEIHGAAGALQALLAGTEFFADAVYAGRLLIKGTFSQFSVVAGASMKVMWDV
ncbi:hypothetical protein [Nocardioides sp. NPDC006303]|uniref:hypothetical protein n=1 Tax=Nocardioides sp. NPDC006303 TaxID=3156747 RepID=UPI0033B6E778